MVAGVVALACWGAWYVGLNAVARGPASPRWLLALAPLPCLGLILATLRFLADPGVRGSALYQCLYAALGMAWVGLAARALPLFGIDPRGDVAERRNPAAAAAGAGALVGAACCFAGGNAGEGPGWPVVLGSAGVATLGWFLTWALLGLLTPVADAVTIDRDRAAGLRLAGRPVAAGAGSALVGLAAGAGAAGRPRAGAGGGACRPV